MKKYGLIAIGSGCGAIISDEMAGHGKKVALVEKGPLGGTCPNLGCIPSKIKMLDPHSSRQGPGDTRGQKTGA